MSKSTGLRTEARPVTTAEADTLRAATDTVVVSANASKSKIRLHLPGADGTPRCQSETAYYGADNDWVAKPLAVYPPGYAEWCGFCGAIYRQEDESHD